MHICFDPFLVNAHGSMNWSLKIGCKWQLWMMSMNCLWLHIVFMAALVFMAAHFCLWLHMTIWFVAAHCFDPFLCLKLTVMLCTLFWPITCQCTLWLHLVSNCFCQICASLGVETVLCIHFNHFTYTNLTHLILHNFDPFAAKTTTYCPFALTFAAKTAT